MTRSSASTAGATVPDARRLAWLVALAVIVGVGIVNLYFAVTGWTLSDAQAYWEAAHRLRVGADLYPVVTDVDASEVYRYAPWFAWLAVPFTYLPVQLAGGLWSLILVAASGAALLPMIRARAWLLVAFFAPILLGISAVGNVQALMIAPLVWGVERRSGPLWIALAASLKIFPILFVLVYLGRREWVRAALAMAVTGLLWAPALVYDLGGYATDPGQAGSLFSIAPLWVLAVGAGCVATAWLARQRYGWLAAAITVVVALPRLFVYDVTYLMVGLPDASRRASSQATTRNAR